MTAWWTWTFIALFVLHELDEIVVLPPFLKKNAKHLQNRFPKRLVAMLDINRKAFCFIAIEELGVILLILWLSNGKWGWAVMMVYLAHILIHIAQGVVLWRLRVPVPPLLSPLWQLPILVFFAARYLPTIPPMMLVLQVFIIGILAVVNLVLMHFIARRRGCVASGQKGKC